MVGAADAAVCAAVRCVASQAAARRPSETQKLYVRVWRDEGCRVLCSSRRASQGVMRGLYSVPFWPQPGVTTVWTVLGVL